MPTIIRTASTWLKVALACMAIGLILFVIGFATNSWMVTHRHNQSRYNGLWKGTWCSGNRCDTRSFSNENSYHQAIQAMECLGLIGFILAFVILLLYMFVDSARRRDFMQASCALAFAGILFSCIGYAIYGSNENLDNMMGVGMDIGWSMGIAIAGTVLYGVAGVMLILHLLGK